MAGAAEPRSFYHFVDSTRRKRGYSMVDSEGAEGVSAMAAAGELGGELLALSVVGPSERFRRNAKAYREALLEVKEQVFGGASAS